MCWFMKYEQMLLIRCISPQRIAKEITQHSKKCLQFQYRYRKNHRGFTVGLDVWIIV